jgi:tetratricopeptide (TPR) repeat protein
MKGKSLLGFRFFASIFYVVLILMAPFVSYAQAIGNLKADSLKNEILNTLNGNNINFWSTNQNANEYYQFNLTDKIIFDNYQIVFKSAKETKPVNIIDLSSVIYKEEPTGIYILNTLSMKVAIKTFSTIEGTPGTKKYEREKEKISQVTNKLYNDLKELQNSLRNEYYYNEVKAFNAIASEYRSLKVKPSISEEQRRFIVQANLLNEKKEYLKALIFYEKVFQLNPVSYPGGYSNSALIASQIQRYSYAIMNMKKYLMLVPEADDARSVQDKIYEWELEIGK